MIIIIVHPLHDVRAQLVGLSVMTIFMNGTPRSRSPTADFTTQERPTRDSWENGYRRTGVVSVTLGRVGRRVSEQHNARV